MAAGRKSKYDTHVKPFINVIKQMRRDGHTEEQIFTQLDVGHTAWSDYKLKYKELAEALKTSKEILIADLEETLFQQALKGNTTALIFSLKNLKPSKWGDKINVSGNMEVKEFGKLLDKFVAKL